MCGKRRRRYYNSFANIQRERDRRIYFYIQSRRNRFGLMTNTATVRVSLSLQTMRERELVHWPPLSFSIATRFLNPLPPLVPNEFFSSSSYFIEQSQVPRLKQRPTDRQGLECCLITNLQGVYTLSASTHTHTHREWEDQRIRERNRANPWKK